MSTELENQTQTSRLIGHLAHRVEKGIVQYILRDTGVEETYFVTINQLDNILNGNCGRRRLKTLSLESQTEKANENWDRLEQAINADSLLYSSIDYFKSWNAFHVNLPLNEVSRRLNTSQDNEEHKNIGFRLLNVLFFLEK